MRLVSSSDHHTLHRRTPTSHVLKNLTEFFYNGVDLHKVDLAFFVGDIFDTSVENSNPDFLRTLRWFKKLFRSCEDTKTIVRIVEGTTLHDWEQSKHIVLTASDKVDVKYINELSIETFDKLDGLTVMYVPDNMASKTPDEIWELALSELAKNNLDTVDLIAMHGGFYYQLPEKGRKHAHIEARWESITRYGIFSGHIHEPSYNGNKIWCNGSFDRCRHGEEHKKGAWIADLDLKKKYFKTTFWENKKALPYITLPVQLDELPEAITVRVKKYLRENKFPDNSQFRLLGGNGSIVSPIVKALEKDFPQFGFAEKSEVDNALIDDELYAGETYREMTLDSGNLFGYLKPIAMPKFEGTDITEEEVSKVLGEFL